MVKYNDKIAKNDKVEFIMVSADGSKEEALTWAKKENFPWPHVQMESYVEKESKLDFKKFEVRGFPTYLLIDAKGKVVAEGKEEVFKKALAK